MPEGLATTLGRTFHSEQRPEVSSIDFATLVGAIKRSFDRIIHDTLMLEGSNTKKDGRWIEIQSRHVSLGHLTVLLETLWSSICRVYSYLLARP